MYSIKRHIETIAKKRAQNSKAIVLTGPRQVGKSTLFRYLFADVPYVTFDDDLLLAQAVEDIGLFMMNNPAPLMIDEVQKCVSVFDRLKIELDNTESYGNYYLTGSQKLQLMEGVSESLAGRVSLLEMEGLSLREINGIDFNRHFVPNEEYISLREEKKKKYEGDLWTVIHRGSYPELYANPGKEWVDFYQSYVKTYLERDVNRLIKAKNHLIFVKFMTSVAARTGQILNYANIASEVGMNEATIREWISILEKSGIVYILKPYTPGVLNRAIRTPKLYFRDTGLCCYLTRWLTPETLKNGAMSGVMFETFVINEILKSYSNEGLDYDFDVFFYNGKDKKRKMVNGKEEKIDGEIDLVIHENGILYPVEIKMTTKPQANMASEFTVLDGIPEKKRGMGAIICLTDRKMYLRENLVALPISYL